jgi:hypothetical protein
LLYRGIHFPIHITSYNNINNKSFQTFEHAIQINRGTQARKQCPVEIYLIENIFKYIELYFNFSSFSNNYNSINWGRGGNTI